MDWLEIEAQFKLICRKCASEKVLVEVEHMVDPFSDEPYHYSKITVTCIYCHSEATFWP